MTVLAARGRGFARLTRYLYEGCRDGDPTAIVITIVLAAIIVGFLVAKVTKAVGRDSSEVPDSDQG